MLQDNIWLVPTVICPSNIHGQGRFADDNISAESIVGILNGAVIPVDGIHLPIRGTGYCIECTNTMINHSRSPNLYIDGQIVIKSRENIDIGEELTLDYRTLTSSISDFY